MDDKCIDIEHLNTANIDNLTRLWRLMGAAPWREDDAGRWWRSHNWPHRCWFEPAPDSAPDPDCPIDRIGGDCIVPWWVTPGPHPVGLGARLTDHGFVPVLEQTAMYRTLHDDGTARPADPDLVAITSPGACAVWAQVAAQAFAYAVDVAVIERLAARPGVQLFLVYVAGQAVATALLYHTGNIAGVHLVGVLNAYRRQGIARRLMQALLNQCRHLRTDYVTLQASHAGAALYRNLGFAPQFNILSYQRPLNDRPDRGQRHERTRRHLPSPRGKTLRPEPDLKRRAGNDATRGDASGADQL